MKSPHLTSACNSASGFTLIELLIAVVIIAVGILGHAVLQLRSMDAGHRARYAQQANHALLDLSQRISALPQAALAGEFDFSNLADGVAPESLNCLDADVNCNRSQFAQYEVAEWWQQSSRLLPELRVSVVTDANLVRINTIWDANKTGVGSAVCDQTGQGHQCGNIELWIR